MKLLQAMEALEKFGRLTGYMGSRPCRRNRKKPETRDEKNPRRYRKRWKVEYFPHAKFPEEKILIISQSFDLMIRF